MTGASDGFKESAIPSITRSIRARGIEVAIFEPMYNEFSAPTFA